MGNAGLTLNSISMLVKNPWGIHARPSSHIVLIGHMYFAEWDIIAINKRSGQEANTKSISEMMQLAIPEGGDVEFLSVMPNDAWEKYVQAVTCLSYQVDSSGSKCNESSYAPLHSILMNARSGQLTCAEFILALQSLLETESQRPFFEPAVSVATPLASDMRTCDVASVISRGESETTEFKSTLRFNLFSKRNDEAIEHAILKTIAAFLNSNGGMLLVGVDDRGNAIGLDSDGFVNTDKMMQHLISLVKEHIGVQHAQRLNLTIREIEGRQVLQVLCTKAMTPAYVTRKNRQILYVRTGPTTTELPLNEVYSYIKHRFSGIS